MYEDFQSNWKMIYREINSSERGKNENERSKNENKQALKNKNMKWKQHKQDDNVLTKTLSLCFQIFIKLSYCLFIFLFLKSYLVPEFIKIESN